LGRGVAWGKWDKEASWMETIRRAGVLMPGMQGKCGGSMREYKKECTEVRPGNVLEKDGKLYQVVKAEHTRGLARQSGNVQIEMKDLTSGTKSSQRMKPGQTLEIAHLEERQLSILYSEGSDIIVMDEKTFEQTALPVKLFSEHESFVNESLQLDEPPNVKALFHKSSPVLCELPPQVSFVIETCDPHSRRQHAQAQYKPAYLPAGTKVMVPHFIEPGNTIVVDVNTGNFVRKEK